MNIRNFKVIGVHMMQEVKATRIFRMFNRLQFNVVYDIANY